MDFSKIKKRYLIGGIVAIVALMKCCSGPSEDEQYQNARYDRAAEDARYMANQEAISQGQPAPYAQSSGQPVIINNQQPSHSSNDGFFTGLMMGHLFSNHNSGPSYEPSRRTVTNVRNVKNVTNVTNHVAPAAPKKPKATSWTQPSTTARSYNVQAPAPSAMKNTTWATSKNKGWGSTTYKSKSTGFKSSRVRRRK